MAKGWPAGVSKVEYKAYKAACENAAMVALGARYFKDALESGTVSRDFFVGLIPNESKINMVKYNENGNMNSNSNNDGGVVSNDGDEGDSDLIPIPGVNNWCLRASRREWIIWKLNVESNNWYQTAVGFRKIEDAIIYVARELQREKILAHKDLTKIGETNKEIIKTFENCIKKSFFIELEGKIKKLSENG
jgi:hypothetical protein